MPPLAHYQIDPTFGFLPATPPLTRLPAPFAAWEQLVPNLSALIRSRGIRAALQGLPVLDAGSLSMPAERERAMLILSVFANAWVWGGEQPHLHIPASVSIPLCSVATLLDRPPITHYASMALNNWQLLDPRAPLSVSNARMQVQFLGGVDEDWFFISAIGVELAAAPMLVLVAAADRASREGSDVELARILDEFGGGVSPVLDALERVRGWCDPHTYYLRVRPFLSGWPGAGVVYEGVSPEPRRLVGGSAGQSSILQAFDAVLGVEHGDTSGGNYLRSIRSYMPKAHRQFVVDIEQSSRVRARAMHGSPALQAAYNSAVGELDRFRRHHMGLAQDYIIKPSGMSAGEQGTGGTMLAAFLAGTQAATARSRV